MKVRLFRFWPIILIILISVILRLYKLEELFYFTYDESIPAFVGKNLLQLGKIPLIGGVTPFGFHITPYFYWLLATLIAISSLNPIIWGISSAIISALTVVLIFLVGKKFFNATTGFYASTIWAFSYLANIYDRHFWALYWGPILCLSTLYFLSDVAKGSKKLVIPLAVAIIWGIATDPSNLVFVVVTILVYSLYKIRVTKMELVSFLLIILSFAPLIVFDIKHNFSNTKPILEYLKSDRTASRFENQDSLSRTLVFTNSFARLILPTIDSEIAKQYSYCGDFVAEKYKQVPLVAKVLAFFALVIFVMTALLRRDTNKKLIAIVIVTYFLGIQAYGLLFNGDIFEHYITGLFPIFILIFSYYLSLIPKRVALLVLALILLLNLSKVLNAKNSHGLTNKRQAVQFVSTKITSEPFSLESLSTCWRYSGYRYLFAAFGREPVKSYVDPNFSHLYGNTPISSTHPNFVATFVTHDFLPEKPEFYERYALYKSYEIENRLFGNIEVIIMNNSSNWF